MRYIKIASLLCTVCMLCACAQQSVPASSQQTVQAESSPLSAASQGPVRVAPAMLLSEFHAEIAQGSGNVQMDVSAAENGYVGVSAVSESRLKFQVVFGDSKYNYDLAQDGTPLIVPLQSGSGSYKLRVMQNTVEDKYIELYSTTVQVQLADDLLPFLYSSSMVYFTQATGSSVKAAQLCANAPDEAAVVAAVYEYIKDNVAYDYDLAASNPKAYVSSPDSTLQTGKGICFDYATLAAAMLRSQGIPTKVITGYVGKNAIYHAWNMFYTEESGWVTVEIAAPDHDWQRIDITFAATGGSAFTGDGSSYTDRYVY